MPLLNYTTNIKSEKTISEIQRMLGKAGASTIAVRYNRGTAAGLAFAIPTDLGERHFTLPVNVERVKKVLINDSVPHRYRTDEQAERVAWRIMKDWLEAQLALISAEMVSLDQVMLPFMQGEGGQTIYELYRSRVLELT